MCVSLCKLGWVERGELLPQPSLYTKGSNAVTAGAEYITEQFRGGATAAALFIDGAYGWDKGSMVMGDAKVYFGNHDKALKRRHREDDPTASPNWMIGHQDMLGDKGPISQCGTI